MSISRSASSYTILPPPARTPSIERVESEIVGNSEAMERLRLQVRRIGPHFRTVLVSGEAGTEKELVARALHSTSPYASEPFLVCHAAVFEDALAKCASQRGTLFLDGINEMPLEAQDRLLRAMRQHELAQNRLNTSQRIELRIVASTAEDLRVLVSTERFRQELHQRLATVDIVVPPLRDRIEDLPELSRCFLSRFALLYGRHVREIADGAMERMQRHLWPGNVRELESMLLGSVLQCEGEMLESHHLPLFAEANQPGQLTNGVRLQDVVEQHVRRILKDCGGNKLRAAEILGISRSTLYRMLDANAPAGISR